ncbi:MAG: hypothetical protein R3F60_18365 [bacterium]
MMAEPNVTCTERRNLACFLLLALGILGCGAASNNVDAALERLEGETADLAALILRIPPWRPGHTYSDEGKFGIYSTEDFEELIAVTCLVERYSDEAIIKAARALDGIDDAPWWTYDGRLYLLARALYRVPRGTYHETVLCERFAGDHRGFGQSEHTSWPLVLDRSGQPSGMWTSEALMLTFPFRAGDAIACYSSRYGRRDLHKSGGCGRGPLGLKEGQR